MVVPPNFFAESNPLAPLPPLEPAGVRRLWEHKLGDVHVKLSNLVGPQPLTLNFDASEPRFVDELMARWPIGADLTAAIHEADIFKLATTLAELARLYALETGHTNLHVLLEARRGHFDLPAHWGAATCLFATYAFTTNFTEVGLFSDVHHAFEDMALLQQPHRLLLAIGPAAPDFIETGDADADVELQRLRALRRWAQQLALQVNKLLADMYDDPDGAAEFLVDGLARMRGITGKVLTNIAQLERRQQGKANTAAVPDLPAPRRRGPAVVEQNPEATLQTALASLKETMLQESRRATPHMRYELQNSLKDLQQIEAAYVHGSTATRTALAGGIKQAAGALAQQKTGNKTEIALVALAKIFSPQTKKRRVIRKRARKVASLRRGATSKTPRRQAGFLAALRRRPTLETPELTPELTLGHAPADQPHMRPAPAPKKKKPSINAPKPMI